MKIIFQVLTHSLVVLVLGTGGLRAAKISDGRQSIEIDLNNKEHPVKAIIDEQTGRNFISGDESVLLYKVDLSDKEGKIVSCDSRSGNLSEKVVDNEILITGDHPEHDITVTIRVGFSDDNLSHWRLDCDNRSDKAIFEVDFPGFAVPQVLGKNPDDTVLIVPNSTTSYRFWNMPAEFLHGYTTLEKKKGPIKWPYKFGDVTPPDALQMLAYYDSSSGLFVGTQDKDVHPKSFSFEGLSDKGMRFPLLHRRPYIFGEDFTMGYDVVIGVIHGDWTAAADIYRTWAEKQPWCAQGKIDERDIPAWLLDYPVYIRMALVHPNSSKEEAFKVWAKLPSYLEQIKNAYPDLYSGAIFHLVDFDVGGYWQGYYNERWPAWMGDESFNKFHVSLKKEGLHPEIEPFGWTITGTGLSYAGLKKSYDIKKQPFYNELVKNTLCWPKSMVFADPPQGPDEIKIYRACPTSEYGKTVFINDALRTCPSGMDMIQIMEIQLVPLLTCFNPNHNHPPGPGQWIYQSVYDAFKSLRETGRKMNPDFVTDKEETAESLIPVLDSVYLRDAQVQTMRWNNRGQLYKNAVPLFDYIYHEYQVFIDGFNSGTSWETKDLETCRWTAGMACVLGHVTGPLFGCLIDERPFYSTAVNSGAWEIVRKARKAYLGYARDYVIFGKVLPSPGVEFPEIQNTEKVTFYNLPPRFKPILSGTREEIITIPTGVESTHMSRKGDIGISFINVTDKTELKLQVPLSKYAKYMKKSEVKVTVRHDHEIVDSQEIDISKPGASIDVAVKPLGFLFITLE